MPSKKPANASETLEAIKKDQSVIVSKGQQIAIVTKEQYEEAANFLVDVKGRINRIEAKRKEYVQPLNDQVKLINADFKAAMKPYQDIEDQVKKRMVVFVESERKAAAEKLKQEEEARRLEAARMAEEEGISTRKALAQIDKPVAEAVPTAVKTDSRTVKTRQITKFAIVDASKVPDEYKVVDETLVRKAVNAGLKIAGVKVWEETIIA